MGAIDNPTIMEGAVKPSAIEVECLEPNLSSHRIMMIESNQQGMWDYLTGTLVVYAGYAPRGLPTSSPSWLLQFYQYDGNSNVIQRQIAYDSWDNRATASYS